MSDEVVVDVTFVSLRVSASMIGRALPLLDEHERALVATRTGDARRRYLAAHAAARVVLGDRLGTDPARVSIASEPGGRPVVDGVAFSLTHSAERAAVAVASPDRRIGVDLELVRPRTHLDRLAQRVFDPSPTSSGMHSRNGPGPVPSRSDGPRSRRCSRRRAPVSRRAWRRRATCLRGGRAPRSMPVPATWERWRPTRRRSRCVRTRFGSETRSHVVTELHAEPRAGLGGLRNAVLPRALTRAAHHEKVAAVQHERV